jgi:uncharacterized protein involved in response to NO
MTPVKVLPARGRVSSRPVRFASHPLWQVGFRPFFALACVAGLALPPLWALIFVGRLPAPATPFSALQWHAHEMFFGFGWAVLGGFLLTATKNWVAIRGYHGPALMLLAAAWLVERLGMWFAGTLPPPLFRLSNNLFLAAIVAMLLYTLIRYRERDSFRDNYFFLIALPAFLVAKQLLLDPERFAAGWGMTLALFRVAFLVMLERTVTQFMKNALQADILRDTRLDLPIKALGLALVVAHWLPDALAATLAALAALLLAVRLAFWKPLRGLSRLDIGVMYLGYLAILCQLAVEAAGRVTTLPWVGALSAHLFAFGAMGLIIPAMMVRIAKGHTGRKVVFDAGDRFVLQLMLAGLALRLLAPQVAPGAYALWIGLAAACWFGCFALLGWRYIPILLRPRIDGREH